MFTQAASCLCALACTVLDEPSVQGQLSHPNPTFPSIEITKGEELLNLLLLIDSAPTGGTTSVLLNGVEAELTIDRTEGSFVADFDMPPGATLTQIHQEGTVAFSGDEVLSGDYVQIDTASATFERRTYDVAFSLEGSRYDLSGADDLGAQFTTEIDLRDDRITIAEMWDAPGEFASQSATTYYLTRGSPLAFVQLVSRDDKTTQEVPLDEEATFELGWENNGSGSVTLHYDHDAYANYAYLFLANGTATEHIVFEDPLTEVSPDGEGDFDFAADASGSGTYVDHYDDGSIYTADYLFRSTYFDDMHWTYDLAETAIALDTEGNLYYEPDRSGTGDYTRYTESGSIETCDYTFDAAGTVLDLTCY